MKLFFQDPGYDKSYTLHEALLKCFTVSNGGGGVYAFVSVEGVKLLLRDDSFTDFIKNGVFTLIVGTDEITNLKTINELKKMVANYPNLKVLAFLNFNRGSLFHPKMTWFKTCEGGFVVVGSGNLTQKGLRRNREIFNIVELSEEDMAIIEQQWNDWLKVNKDNLYELDNEKVENRVKENVPIRSKITKKLKEKKTPEEVISEIDIVDDNEDIGAWNFSIDDEVLVTEISNNNARLSQVNFHKEDFLDFFGAVIGDKNIRILLKHVDDLGTLSDTESRSFVKVQSQNYRIELNAMKGITYPDVEKEGRPIGVFIRIANRMVLYALYFPTDALYHDLKIFLYNKTKVSSNSVRMVKYYTHVSELIKEQSKLSILKHEYNRGLV